MRLHRMYAAAFGLFAVAVGLTPLAGQTVTVGTGNTNNCYPFSCPAFGGLTEYQQVYAASAFSDPIFISELTFFDDPTFDKAYFSSALFTIHLSTTSSAVGALSGSLGSNVGSDNALFGVFSLPTGIAPSQFTLTGTPFYYSPLAGNLLMDITLAGGSDGQVFEALLADHSGSVTSRATNTLVDRFGLVTEFTYTPANVTPEPATLTLFATGLVGLAGAGLRRQKKASRRDHRGDRR